MKTIKENKLFLIPIALVLIALIMALYEFVIFPRVQASEVGTYETTVIWKECVNYGYFWLEGKYLIFTRDANGEIHVFENMDNAHVDKKKTSDIYADIDVGSTYRFTVIGKRDYNNEAHPYQNIVDYELLE